MFEEFQMVFMFLCFFLLFMPLLDNIPSQKIHERYNNFLLSKEILLSIQSVFLFFFSHATLRQHEKAFLFFY